MSGDYSISLTGVADAMQRLETSAQRIAKANPGSLSVPEKSVDNSDIIADVIDVKQAAIDFKANLNVLSVQEKLDKDTLDLCASNKRS
jgi:hypothetical protein